MTITPFVFASEAKAGQTIIDPCDGVARTVAGDIIGRANDQVLIAFRDGTELDVWRHKPLDLVDVDELHGRARREEARRVMFRNFLAQKDFVVVGNMATQTSRPGWQRREIANNLHQRALREYEALRLRGNDDSSPASGGLTPEEAYAIECGNPWT